MSLKSYKLVCFLLFLIFYFFCLSRLLWVIFGNSSKWAFCSTVKCRRQCYFSTKGWVFVRISFSGFVTIYIEISRWTQVQMEKGRGNAEWLVCMFCSVHFLHFRKNDSSTNTDVTYCVGHSKPLQICTTHLSFNDENLCGMKLNGAFPKLWNMIKDILWGWRVTVFSYGDDNGLLVTSYIT